MSRRLMSEYRGDTPEDPDTNFNINLVSIEFNQDFWHSYDLAPMRMAGAKALNHTEILQVCDNLNDRLVAIGFYNGYLPENDVP